MITHLTTKEGWARFSMSLVLLSQLRHTRFHVWYYRCRPNDETLDADQLVHIYKLLVS